MLCISVKEFLFWKKKQLSKGGDYQSFAFLLNCKGDISTSDLTFLTTDPDGKLYLKKDLEYLESIWSDYLINGTPIQYLCGVSYWRNLKLRVTDKVLIPRPETELVIDIVFKIFGKKSQKLFFAELGTGSGAISIALALEFPMWEGIATDIDQDALEVATKNYKSFSEESNLKFCCGDWWTPLESFRGKLDLVISNPPYIQEILMKNCPKKSKILNLRLH